MSTEQREAKQFSPEQDAIRLALHHKLMEMGGHLDPVSVAYVVAVFAGEALGALLLSLGISRDDIVAGAKDNIEFGVDAVMSTLAGMRGGSH